MFKRLLIAAAASGLAAGAAAASPQAPSRAAPLPDFPRDARAGECWARLPVGSPARPASGSQAVWTLQRGAGPGAIWSYSEKPGSPGPLAVGPLDWSRVDCISGEPLRLAEGPPPPSLPVYAEAPPPPHPAPALARHPIAPPAPPAFEPLPFSGQGPYAGGAFHAPPPHHGLGPMPHGHPHHPPLHVHPHPHPHPHGHSGVALRQPVAPWFGGRMLNWPGKTLR